MASVWEWLFHMGRGHFIMGMGVVRGVAFHMQVWEWLLTHTSCIVKNGESGSSIFWSSVIRRGLKVSMKFSCNK